MLLLAGMYCAHSGWIQSEIEAAKDCGKPIIAMEPRGQERFPEAVRRAADAIVGWSRDSIIDAVRRLVPPTFGFAASLANLFKPAPSEPLALNQYLASGSVNPSGLRTRILEALTPPPYRR